MSDLMAGKRGLIMGLANDKSLAWGIAQKLAQHGASLAFSYQGEALGKRVIPLAEQLGSNFCFDCDVSDMAALDRYMINAVAAFELQAVDYLLKPYNDVRFKAAIDRAKKLFGAEHANVQPHSGSNANLAVYLAFLGEAATAGANRYSWSSSVKTMRSAVDSTILTT